MTQLERQIKTAQHRLWLDRFLTCGGWCLTIAFGVFAGVVLVQRLYDLAMPLTWVAAGMAGVSLMASILWTAAGRADAATAAARLDEAAGLRERISSAQYCGPTDDPFAQAVVADAERVSGSLSARQHIRLTTPSSLGWTIVAMAAIGLMFLVPPGLALTEEATVAKGQAQETQEVKVAVKRKMDEVRQLVAKTPGLEEMKETLADTDKKAGGKLQRPDQIRHEAVKKIDKLADAVKQERGKDKYKSLTEMRKMMRSLKVPKSSDVATQKLTKALSQGDFKSAKEEVQKLKEQLATLKAKDDQEMAKKLSQQLDELAKQLEKVGDDKKQMEKLLEQAGIKKEDAERMLENLKKQDLEQLQKQLQEKGLGQKQAEQLAKQLQQKQQAGSMAQKLAEAAKQGAKGSQDGQAGEAMAGMTMAEQQLSELEQLEQEMSQLDSTLSDLENSKNDLDKPCSNCGGKGCSKCGGTGQGKSGSGMGNKAKSGRGGLASEEETNVDFKVERGKVPTREGAIIGQFFFEGEQVKGEVSSEFADVVTAAERDATDRINRNRMPRQYQKAVRAYFSNVQKQIESAKLRPAEAPKNEPEGKPSESPSDKDND